MSTELDHHGIKQQLKEYLSQQKEFTEYNFEGSNLSMLLDVLAYNTHYNALYANMIVNEQFLDSAIKRANIVSLAKHLGYVPKSKAAAGILVDITLTDPSSTTYTLPRYSEFTGVKEGKSFPFVNVAPATAHSPTGTFTFRNVELMQGRLINLSYTVENDTQKFTIPSENLDIDTLRVVVQASSTSEFTRYTKGNYFRNYDSSSLIYFVEEDARGFFTLYFGDGVIGKKLQPGNIVKITYLVTRGAEANDIRNFTTTLSANSITPSEPNGRTAGGSEKEDVKSIKFNAPRFYASQGRAITTEDYKNIILTEIPEVESINVWGGETMNPPQYGRVYISIKPKGSDRISTLLNSSVVRTLRNRGIVSIVPAIVEPDYIYMGFVLDVWINDNIETNTQTIENVVRTKVTDFFVNNLQKFDADFKHSKFIKAIDESSESIDSVTSIITLQKRIVPLRSQLVSFSNQMKPGTVVSERCFFNVFGITREGKVEDKDGLLVFVWGDNRIFQVGEINYSTGEVRVDFTNFIGNVETTRTRFHIKGEIEMTSRNVNTEQNQILLINDTETGVLIAVKDDRLA